ncbi:aminoacylase-1 isoform a [Dimargaris cristalligena]|uniref:N-acyl-aliphatic-L-amino acid amidohydrolase n=1 Tax=Dimargaris cristalligena TaxID=215637 RepID=A0A4Q0A0J1_9FUNG|nr:aminoacylase-1 isoform a [Dimargaris cristalligena]|eukprot:RKP39517.1 aminoacylase-1 isoform a [Dimargaris cristalligena]
MTSAPLPQFPPSVDRFQQYLRIKTVQPDPDYSTCTQFLLQQAAELDLAVQTYEMAPDRPIVILSWPGQDPTLPSLALNSHTDVVPVYEAFWDHAPFAAVIVPAPSSADPTKTEYRIVARGAQDMKIVGMCYLEAIRKLKARGITQLLRTIHVLFVPDEEIGSHRGMELFCHHPGFEALNIGAFLDEGVAHPGNMYKLFHSEKAPWWTKFTAHGNTGHGSQFIQGTAMTKIMGVVNELLAFRDREEHHEGESRAQFAPRLRLGDVTSVNLTMLHCGKQVNVVPESVEASFDIRVTPFTDFNAFDAYLHKLAQDHGVELEFIQKYTARNITDLDDNNPWWGVIQNVTKQLDIALDVDVFAGATDARFVRPLGIPAFGISPMRNTPILLHDHNEYVTVDCFLEGINFYEHLIEGLANMKPEA